MTGFHNNFTTAARSTSSLLAMVFALGVAGHSLDADAAKKRVKSKTVAAHKAAKGGANVNISHCESFAPTSPPERGTKPTANAEARLVPDGAGDYKIIMLDGGKNMQERLPIASLAKQMTAYLVYQDIHAGRLKLDQMVPMNPNHYCLPDNNFATVQMPRGVWEFQVGELLSLLLRQSNNSAALALADAVAGNSEKFVDRMNAQARAWGMTNTHFTSPHGLPPPNRAAEYTTASDLIILGKNLLQFEPDYQASLNAPLTAAGKPIEVGGSYLKKKVMELSSIWKTGTSKGCFSLLSVFNVPRSTDKLVTVQLCAHNDASRFQNVLNRFAQFIKGGFSSTTMTFSANATDEVAPPDIGPTPLSATGVTSLSGGTSLSNRVATQTQRKPNELSPQ